MAFCNSCGATLDAGTKFCNKCGAAVPASSTPAAATQPGSTPAPGQKGGSSALKIILIIVAVIVGLGILGIGTTAFFIHRAISRSHIEEKNGKVKIESPFGNLETTTDPDEAVKNVGVDLYPGAEVQKNGSASMTIAGMHTATAILETEDSPDKVAEFYKSKLSNITYSANQGNRYTMMAGDKNDMTTINVEPRGAGSTIQISHVTKAGSN